jgi:hypothetical protein
VEESHKETYLAIFKDQIWDRGGMGYFKNNIRYVKRKQKNKKRNSLFDNYLMIG